jgi:phage shock protein B
MSQIAIAFMVPTILFMVIVAPIWLVLHYRSKNKEATSLGDEEHQLLEQLTRSAVKMEERLSALEKILDAEDPTWKEKVQ